MRVPARSKASFVAPGQLSGSTVPNTLPGGDGVGEQGDGGGRACAVYNQKRVSNPWWGLAMNVSYTT